MKHLFISFYIHDLQPTAGINRYIPCSLVVELDAFDQITHGCLLGIKQQIAARKNVYEDCIILMNFIEL
jgi:hypothetical protein